MNTTQRARDARRKYAPDYYARTKVKQLECQARWEKRAAANNQNSRKGGNTSGKGN